MTKSSKPVWEAEFERLSNYFGEDITSEEWKKIEKKIVQTKKDYEKQQKLNLPKYRHRFRRIREATGIPTEWINTFAFGWTYEECKKKIVGITKWGDPSQKNNSIDNCIEELVNSIGEKRKFIKKNWESLSYNPAIITVTFRADYLNQINSACKDKLYKKIKAEIVLLIAAAIIKDSGQETGETKIWERKKNLETFISRWRKNVKKESRENHSRMKDDIDAEEFISIYQGKKVNPLSRLIYEKNKQWYFKRTKAEDETTEFKDSWYANLERMNGDYNEYKEFVKKHPEKNITEKQWLNGKDKGVQFGILKCVCSFLNTKGGTIWLGVDNDDAKIIGLSNVKKREKFTNDDGTTMDDRQIMDALTLEVEQEVRNKFADFLPNISYTHHVAPGNELLYTINVEPTYPSDATIERDGKDEFYVRIGSSCTMIKGLKKINGWREKRGDKAPNKKKS